MADKVLVVDDDAGLQETLQAVLQFEGFDVMIAADGVEALEKLEMERPRVIVLDWAMPRMDGPTFAAALQARGLRPAIPILMLTADGRARQKGTQIAAEAVMSKPFDMTELVDQVARLAATS